MANTKNYTEHGGSVTHIGGELVLDPGSKIIKDGQEIDIGGGKSKLIDIEIRRDEESYTIYEAPDANEVVTDILNGYDYRIRVKDVYADPDYYYNYYSLAHVDPSLINGEALAHGAPVYPIMFRSLFVDRTVYINLDDGEFVWGCEP